MTWNPSEYGGLDVLHVGVHEIWQPDISLYNSAIGASIDHYGATNILVYNNGSILWVPPSQFTTFCDLNLRHWPYDSHSCHVILGSWTFHGNQIDITNEDDSFTDDTMVENHQWKINKMESTRNVRTYACCEEPYVDIDFEIAIERRSPMFNSVVLTPATIIILMTLANFWLPAQAGEKILLNGINAIIIVAFLLYFAQKLPAMAVHTPLVGE